MKRRGLAWLLALVTALALTGCGAAGSTEMATADDSSSSVMDESALAEPQAAYGTDGGTSGGASTGERTAKRIYTADLELETTALTRRQRIWKHWWKRAAGISSPAVSAAAEVITATLTIPFGYRQNSTGPSWTRRGHCAIS